MAEGAVVPLMQSVPSAGWGKNLEFANGAVDSCSSPLHEGHDGIFNVHQQIVADRILI